MPSFNVVVFGGDHCGPEVTAEAIKILKVIEKKRDVTFNLQDHLLGGASIDATGSPLTDEALEAAKSADAVLLGAIGGPVRPIPSSEQAKGVQKRRHILTQPCPSLEMGYRRRPSRAGYPASAQGNGYIRQPASLQLRRSLAGRELPLKADVCRGVDFNIIRELTGGIYFGDRKEDDGSGFAMDTEPYSRAEIERIIRLAAHLALQHNPPLPVWSLDKANVLATSRLWRKVVTEVMEKEFPQVQIGHHLIDSAAMLMIKDPRKLNGIVVTSNLFGDIISDEASVIPGSLGLLPSASLSGIPDGKSRVNGIYEPIHGSAPDIAGKGIVNPVAAILSVAMMMQYSFGMFDEARIIEKAVENVIEAGVRTGDIGGEATTIEVGNAIAVELEKLL
ncbi:3-isopropylmalate dehydrogenase A [Penicillium subrubescens]|uniref:3-isopropylmalate dehydrogenase A n=1 Tax=Penicillium subrubescens TaxID=1316194 RepID=UPI0025452063|nr:3-isopropylmalate dehydrogenase A [Penicillium subrubescens]KAJ5883336.1 3-isopropylmalate dehydrogenase A [Penicillium subrubescens]